MSRYQERAEQLRRSESRHYNCCQAVLCTFADLCGLQEGQAYAMGVHFGSGMRLGGPCGALVGALMVLGLLGKPAMPAIQGWRARNTRVNCPELLAAARDRGELQGPHCDRMVYDAVALVEQQL